MRNFSYCSTTLVFKYYIYNKNCGNYKYGNTVIIINHSIEIYRYKLDAKTISLLIILIAALNLSSNSLLPMVFDACTICLSNSSSRLMHLIMEPSNISVILHNSLNIAPLHQANTTSIKNGRNFSTYASSSNANRASVLTLAIRLAKSY